MRYRALLENNSAAYALSNHLLVELKAELNKQQQDLLFFSINLLGLAMSDGHVCLVLERYENTQALRESRVDYTFPDAEAWQSFLLQLSVVNNPQQPYLNLENGRLYLNKYAVYEQQLAQGLLEKSRSGKDCFELESPQATPSTIDWQAVAARNSALQSLSIVVGGPGTGKTTTVIKILENILQCEGHADYRIGLAAPTGKAATRLSESLAEKIQQSNMADEHKALLPAAAKTLHRLLGYSQGQRKFLFNQQRPLDIDCLIVDEVSMIDLSMFCALLQAVPAHCRLILLGDPYQLASVQAGNVLAEICQDQGLRLYSSAQAAKLQLGYEHITNSPVALADNMTLLRVSYRFNDEQGIGLLARALLQQDKNLLQQALAQDEVQHFDKLQAHSEADFFARAFAHYQYVASQPTIEEAFAVLAEFQLLCATKQGTGSVTDFHQQFFKRISFDVRAHKEPLYQAMPIMMTQNNYALNLYNGDLGLVWPFQGQLFLYFQNSDGSLQRFLPSQLPGWVCAHAITVHKSQGSEYAEVALSMPELQSPLLSREMFYTAVTRAKKRFYCLATMAQMQQALQQAGERYSGLAIRLQQGFDNE